MAKLSKKILVLVFLLGFTASVAADPLIRWKMDEGSGQKVKDSIGDNTAWRGWNNTSIKDPEWVSGIQGSNALDFDKNNEDLVYAPFKTGQNFDNTTVTAWVNPDDVSGNNGIVEKTDAYKMGIYEGELVGAVWRESGYDCSAGFSGWCDNGTWDSSYYNGWVPSGMDIAENTWTEISMTWNQTHFRFTKDPENGPLQKRVREINEPSNNIEIIENDKDIGIGAKDPDKSGDSDDGHFDGVIDDVRIYPTSKKANNTPIWIKDYHPLNGTKLKPGSFDMNVSLNHTDNEDMSVKFYDDNGDQIGAIQTVSGGSGTAEVQHQAAGSGKKFNWYVEITDGDDKIGRTYLYNTFSDTAPTFSKASPKNNNEVNLYPVNLSVFVDDDFASNIDVEFLDDGGNTIKTDTVSSGTFANASYTGLSPGNSYNWTIEATDDRSNTNSFEYEFYYDREPYLPVNIELETNYSEIISSEGSSTVVPFRITNPSSVKEINVTITGTSNARFVDGTDFKRLTMDKGTETFLVEVKPDSPGHKQIGLKVRNLQYRTITKVNKDVYVKESASAYEPKNVPGIGGIQIASLLMISTLAYFALL